MKRVILFLILLFFIGSAAYAIRLPNKGIYEGLNEYMWQLQEEEVAHSRDPNVFRKSSADKKPWLADSLWDMETRVWPGPDRPPIIPEIPDPIVEPIVPIIIPWYIKGCRLSCPPIIRDNDCNASYT